MACRHHRRACKECPDAESYLSDGNGFPLESASVFADPEADAGRTRERFLSVLETRLHAQLRRPYPIEDGCVEHVCFEVHRRGRNWMAFVEPDRASPGGLRRVFWERGSERWYKFPWLPKPGDVIEMGGDYFTAGSQRISDRIYIMVVETEETCFLGFPMGKRKPSKSAIEEGKFLGGASGS